MYLSLASANGCEQLSIKKPDVADLMQSGTTVISDLGLYAKLVVQTL